MYRISIHPGDVLERAGGIDEGFALLARCGIEGVQFGMSYFFMKPDVVRANAPSVMDEPLEVILEALRPYKEAAKRHGVAISQVHAPFPTWMLGNDTLNRRMPAVLLKSIAATEYMESPHIIIHPAFCARNQDRWMPEQEWELNRNIYTALIPALREHHVMCLLENMFNRDVEGTRYAAACTDFHEAAEWVDQLNDIAGEELFGFCLDTGLCQLARQNLHRAVHIMGHRIKALHMQENNGHLDDHRAPFTGTTNWELFLDALKEIHYRGDLNFEATNGINLYPKALTEAAVTMQAQIGRYFRKRLTENAE